MTRVTPWAQRYYDQAPFGRGERPGFGTVSDEERAIMDEILDAEPVRDVGTVLAETLVGLFETWTGRGLDGGPTRDPELSALPYADYLRTPHWVATRHRALKRAGWRCTRCEKSNGQLDVHHLTYDRVGCEREADLTVLCRPCHAAEHGKPPQETTP